MANLVLFNSKAAAEFYMLPEHARAVLAAIGKDLTTDGIITPAQVPAARQALQAAVDCAAPPPADLDDPDQAPPPAMTRAVGFAQRAFPLLAMLRAAEKKSLDVIWRA